LAVPKWGGSQERGLAADRERDVSSSKSDEELERALVARVGKLRNGAVQFDRLELRREQEFAGLASNPGNAGSSAPATVQRTALRRAEPSTLTVKESASPNAKVYIGTYL
jgi:hypothetical protein